MKKIYLLLLSVSFFGLSAQNNSLSVLTSEKYFENPKLYLSKLNQSKITTNVLIDKSIPQEDLFEYNGISKVKNGNYYLWRNLYSSIHNAHKDTSFIPKLTTIDSLSQFYSEYDNVYPISMLHFKFNKITSQAIANNNFIESNGFLVDNNSTTASYSNNRLFASNVLISSIYGDNITFLIPQNLYLSNITDEYVTNLQIDFGNGAGFKVVNFNEVINVVFSSISKYELVKIRMEVTNTQTNTKTVYYSHFSFFRIGTSTVPEPDVVEANRNAPNPDKQVYYPQGAYVTKVIRFCYPCGRFTCCDDKTVTMLVGRKLEVAFYFNPLNTSGKLRRPLIVCDGFDPGNKRSYAKNNMILDEGTPKGNDIRGLYNLLNGDPSPWYAGDPSPGLVESLKAAGYDIVLVNFLNGDGDIEDNANALRGLLNNVINSFEYRDNQTEEITLIGPSMGGIITRLTLSSMESATPSEEHYVKNWISFDAPHKGAYIPLGLQYAMSFLTKINDGDLESLEDAKIKFKNALDALNTTAAKQLLLRHYTVGEQRTNQSIALYQKLDLLGYPKLSKNYTISSAGTSVLYDGTGLEILDFKITPWTYVNAWNNYNSDGTTPIFFGSRQGFNNDETKSASNQIAFENAPGGWNSSLYLLNCQPKNKNKKSDTDTRYTKATFMPTASTLGIAVTRENIFKTWDQYTNCNDNTSGKIKTPFDEIRGVVGQSEEHVRITVNTANYLLTELKNNFTKFTYPPVRSAQSSNKSVSGNVAYNAFDEIIFAGDNNTFSIKSGADVIAKSGKSIVFRSGFSVKAGAKFRAFVEPVFYGNQSRSLQTNKTEPIDYTKPSPFSGKVYDYSKNMNNPSVLTEMFSLRTFPNPTDGSLKLFVQGGESEFTTIKLYNIMGDELMSTDISEDSYELDLSRYSSGVYILKSYNNSSELITKIVKQ